MNTTPSSNPREETPLIQTAKRVLTLQKDVARTLRRARDGRTYIAIAPFAWAKDADAVKTLRHARSKIPAHVPRESRKILLYEAPADTQVDMFDGSLRLPSNTRAKDAAVLVARLDH